jgi:predicted amidohydrolase
MIGGSCIISPSGQIVARCAGVGDELAVAECDLDDTVSYKESVFNFARHRQPTFYSRIVDQVGVERD